MQAQLVFLILFAAFPFFVVLVRNILADIYLWQVKEYRLDRVWSQIRFEKEKSLQSERVLFLKIGFITVLVAAIVLSNTALIVVTMAFIWFWYWYESLVFLQQLVRKKFFKPRLKSVRNLIIFAITIIVLLMPLVVLVIWVLNPEMNLAISNLIHNLVPKDAFGTVLLRAEYNLVLLITIFSLGYDLLGFILIAAGVALTWPLSYFSRQLIIMRAKRKMAKLKGLKVVAVTGSYGKSTTKELVQQILRQKYNTVKTEKNNNTDIGIAKTILKSLNKSSEIFVAEMGAYKINEIEDCCEIAPPSVAIITGVDQQHVSLFGGISEVLASTYEVVEQLKKGGLLILNGDNEYCLKIAEKAPSRKVMYFSVHNQSKLEASELSFEKEEVVIPHKINFPGNENVFVKEITHSKKGLNFVINAEGVDIPVKTNLKALFNISNLLAAILAARECGMTMDEIVSVVNNLDFNVPYLNEHQGINGSKIVDDGYNSSPTGFISALKFFRDQKYKGKTWVMTQGIIELGPGRDATNKQIASELVKSADCLYTTDRSLFEAVLKVKPDFEAKLVNSVFDFIPYYEHLVKKGQAVLIEGAFPQAVLKRIYQDYY